MASIHGDHLGSVSVVTNWYNGGVVSSQKFDAWGKVRSGGVSQTTMNYTGQKLDGTGLLFYNARYYDPNIAKFVSADTIVPGTAGASGGSAATLGYDSNVALRPLTVGFHETQFVSALNEENRFTQEMGFYFQLGDKDKEKAKYQWGAPNPQALNRYSYVLNNPIKYTDPTGHSVYMDKAETEAYVKNLRTAAGVMRDWATTLSNGGGMLGGTLAVVAAALAKLVGAKVGAIMALLASLVGIGGLVASQFALKIAQDLDILANIIEATNNDLDNRGLGVAIKAECEGLRFQCRVTILGQGSGAETWMEPSGGIATMWWWSGFFKGGRNKSIFEPGSTCNLQGIRYTGYLRHQFKEDVGKGCS
jgi:RHS repeat-associated protein